jgi:alpha-galactosidase
MTQQASHFLLHGSHSTLLIAAAVNERPSVIYYGARLNETVTAEEILRLRRRQGSVGTTADEIPASLSCEVGLGLPGPSGLELHRHGADWAPSFFVQRVRVTEDKERLIIEAEDRAKTLRLTYHFTLRYDQNVLRLTTTLQNLSKEEVTLNWLSPICCPLPPNMTEVLGFSGRWAAEFQMEHHTLPSGTYMIENHRGRTSHDRFPGLVVSEATTTEARGTCIGAHFGWSGNHRMRIDTLADGRRFLQAGELFRPGEMILAGNETYETPPLFLCHASDGFTAMSQDYHQYFHETLRDNRVVNKPRPVHYNTWEAIYFDHTPEKVMQLANAAAALGTERFVLDDGWMKGRRHDRAGLGDWVVDPAIYPDGLGPVIDHVHAKGMEFGLWVEPEMINEDSDLFRAHPDWVLSGAGEPQINFRHQLVLDLTRPEVCESIFEQIDALLTEYDITYLKWDMNRDLNHPGGANDRAVTSAQNRAVYSLIQRLRDRHRQVEIETCSSGGARADYGILAHTDRIWTSDSNDALDRQLIQRGASYFFPLSIMGAHVGPRDCHITGRHLSMGLRAATAMFGHMGVEANLLEMSDTDRAELADAIALYKMHRALLHSGRFVRLDGPAYQNAVGVVAEDQSEALFSWAQLATNRDILPGTLYFTGLASEKTYNLKAIWPGNIKTPFPHRLEGDELLTTGYTAKGDVLMKAGLQLPLLFPETAIVFYLKEVTS